MGLMAHPGQLRWGVPLGALFVAIASWGVMDLLGTFDDPDERVAASHDARGARAAHRWPSSPRAFCSARSSASRTAGAACPSGWGILVTLAFVGAAVTLFELGQRLGVWKTAEALDGAVDPPFWKRHGFWVVVVAAALYFPFMGTTPCGIRGRPTTARSSREILARDDWISLWWAQDGWFWSKPVLDMWMQAIAMATLGVHYQPDKMLIGDGTQPD